MPGFYYRISAKRNLEFFGGFYPISGVSAQADRYLKLMGLWDRRYDKVSTFSKGMRQRLALARALLHEPQILLLDEPTAGLDPEAAKEVREFIRSLSRQGRTIFLSTHNLAEAENICHRVALVRRQILALDTPENLRQRLFQRQVVVKMNSINESIVATVKKLYFVRTISVDGARLIIELSDFENNRPNLIESIVLSGGRIQEVSEAKHTLEDVYLMLVHEEAKGTSIDGED